MHSLGPASSLSCCCHKTRERERASEREGAFPLPITTHSHTHTHSHSSCAYGVNAAAYGRLALPALMSLTRLTGAVTVAAATIMESEMDISLMRLHITRSAINQTGWLHHAGRGMGKSEKEKSEGKIKRGIGWTTMTKIKSKCHKIPQCCEGKGLLREVEKEGERGGCCLPALANNK